jgi:hypothetical protein
VAVALVAVALVAVALVEVAQTITVYASVQCRSCSLLL